MQMNFCSIEEAFGSDPYIDSMNQNQSNVHENFGMPGECGMSDNCDYDMDSIDSYASYSSVNDTPFLEMSPSMSSNMSSCGKRKRRVPYSKPPMCAPYSRPVQNMSLRNDEMISAIMYIISGMYVIFILDVFVRMGSKI